MAAVSIRPEISDARMGLAGAGVPWQTRCLNMQDVCLNCHNKQWVENFYVQYDSLVELYNTKFGRPGSELYSLAGPLLSQVKFANPLDFVWYEIWHHAGRRARHGASMMGPDYTHWHGTYEVAKRWYTEFIPELERLVKEGMASGQDEQVKAAESSGLGSAAPWRATITSGSSGRWIRRRRSDAGRRPSSSRPGIPTRERVAGRPVAGVAMADPRVSQSPQEMDADLLEQQARWGFLEHLRTRAAEARRRHGPAIDTESILRMLDDRQSVRYPTSVCFDAAPLRRGEFAYAKPLGFHPSDGYSLCIHPHFEHQLEVLPLLIAYHIAVVNYGSIVEPEHAEVFAATLLGLEPEPYYHALCELADSIPERG